MKHIKCLTLALFALSLLACFRLEVGIELRNSQLELKIAGGKLEEIRFNQALVCRNDGNVPVNQMHAWAGFESIESLPAIKSFAIADDDTQHAVTLASSCHSVEYRLEGCRLLVKIILQNMTQQTIRAWRFALPCIQFGSQPVGFYSQVPIGALQNFTGSYYPGQYVRIGACWLTTPGLTVAAYRIGTPTHRYLFWLRSDYGDDPKRPLWYIDLEPIEPGGAVIRELAFHFSTDTNWQTSWVPYRDQLPQANYTPTGNQVAGPMIQSLRTQLAACTPENPYGYSNLNWRFDTAAGATAYKDYIQAQATRLNARGLIHWSLGVTRGEKKFGVYALNPTRIGPEVEANFPLLFDQMGCPAGHLLRMDYLQAQNETDPGLPVNYDETTVQLLRKMMGRAPLYLDSTGFEADPREARLIHYRLLRRLRDEIQTGDWYVEHANDLTLGSCGGYGMLMRSPWEVYQVGALQWQMLRWLRPQADWIVGQLEGFGVEPSRWTRTPIEVIAGCQSLGVIPLLQDWRLEGVRIAKQERSP